MVAWIAEQRSGRAWGIQLLLGGTVSETHARRPEFEVVQVREHRAEVVLVPRVPWVVLDVSS